MCQIPKLGKVLVLTSANKSGSLSWTCQCTRGLLSQKTLQGFFIGHNFMDQPSSSNCCISI